MHAQIFSECHYFNHSVCVPDLAFVVDIPFGTAIALRKVMNSEMQQIGKVSMNLEDVLDHAMIEELREIIEEGQPDLASEMIQIFLGDVPDRLARLAQGVAEQDCEKIKQASHSIKGSASQLGAKRLAAISSEMERCAKAGDLRNMQNMHETFLAEFYIARTALEAEIRCPAA